jgi:hypothetical protein
MLPCEVNVEHSSDKSSHCSGSSIESKSSNCKRENKRITRTFTSGYIAALVLLSVWTAMYVRLTLLRNLDWMDREALYRAGVRDHPQVTAAEFVPIVF